MYGQPQLIPGVVRKASVALPTTPPSCNVNKTKTWNPQPSIIPGSIRPVACNTSLNQSSTNSVPAVITETTASPDQLTNKAVEEILRETRLGKLRAEEYGSTAWRPCPLRKTNKRFLNRTLVSMVNHNDRVKQKTTHRSRIKLSELVRREGGDKWKPASNSSKTKTRDWSKDTDTSLAVNNLIEDSD
ncbi:uncharacterized protein LOC128715250 [Anopheles marshallii]|uniref:uncharacterized protein LOC128715250 n=1 Tax=Anopheles marshallii TaxID=1521116 RepID=UPI00237B6375|nr:uncharacterized protein LOC128715250 [Anopheles marshallii]